MIDPRSRRETLRRSSIPVGGADETAILHMQELLRKDTEGVFRIERQLGKGGMAVVYLATEIGLERRVALKVLPPTLTFAEGVERFQREAKMAASLDHPNIIPIYRISSGSELFWYAMKYVQGVTLADHLHDQGQCSLAETIELLTPVAHALDYAHERGVIHRDVKPSNVMIDGNGRVVVTDFGIAKAASSATLTGSGVALGTPTYMSPEQANGAEVGGASDQYALGVVAYRMLSGQIPFEADTPVAIIAKHLTADPPPLDVLCPNLPAPVHEAVHRALAKRPDDRWPSLTAFIDAMKVEDPSVEIRTALPPRAPPAERRPDDARTVTQPTPDVDKAIARRSPDGRHARHRSGWVVSTAAIALLGIAGAVMLFFAGSGTASVSLDELRAEQVTLSLAGEPSAASSASNAQPITELLTVRTLYVSGHDSIYVPPTGQVRRMVDRRQNVEFGSGSRESGSITLQPLELAPGTRLEVSASEQPGQYRIGLDRTSNPIRVAMAGSVLLASDGEREVLAFPIGSEPVLIYPDSRRQLNLEFALAAPARLAEAVRVNDLDVLRREKDPMAERPRIDTLSTVISGQLRVGDHEYPLGTREELVFDSFVGTVRGLELADSAIVMHADGRVSGVWIGFREPRRDRMPRNAGARVAGLGVGALSMIGLVYVGLQLLRRKES